MNKFFKKLNIVIIVSGVLETKRNNKTNESVCDKPRNDFKF